MFKNPIFFNGRISKKEYAISYLISSIMLLIIAILVKVFTHEGKLNDLYFYIFSFPVGWFLIAQGVKRCHDTGRSGAFLWIPFFAFILIFLEKDNVYNIYGPDPESAGLLTQESFEEHVKDGYCIIYEDEIFGPYDIETMKKMKSVGTITAETMVSFGVNGEWNKLKEFNEI